MKKNKGITLVALVVTIVVLLILAGVSINLVLGNNGIIAKAKDAETKSAEASENDLKGMNALVSEMEGALAGNGSTGNGNTGSGNNFVTKNTEVTYPDGKVWIPEGFRISTDSASTVQGGVVIEDKDLNQFVWVPVATLADYKRRTWYTGNGSFSDYSEALPEDEKTSVEIYKGFYIGRYEAGTTDKRTKETTGISKVVVKRDAYPYIYVKWGEGMATVGEEGAVYLSKNMYSANEIGATSTLCYGVQWDAIMKFVEDSTHSITNSTTWGNYKNNAWTIERTTAQYTDTTNVKTGNWTAITSDKSKTSSASYLLTTGASDTCKKMNIYDLAGNVREWTLERYSGRTSRCADRGGCYASSSSYSVSGHTYMDDTSGTPNLGFRLSLYK